MAQVNREDYEARDRTIALVDAARDQYSPRFRDWLLTNWLVWIEFRKAAHAVRGRGIREYSAYVIVNVLRWQADVRGIKFAFSNTMTPDIARLYNAMYGPLFKTSSRFSREMKDAVS